MGRPKGTGYKKEYDHLAYIACVEGGFTLPKLAKLLKVSRATVCNWKRDNPSFLDAIKKGSDEFNVFTAEDCLLKRVRGYRYTEATKELKGEKLVLTKVVTKSLHPDPLSIIFFLKCRDRARWLQPKDSEVDGASHEESLKELGEA